MSATPPEEAAERVAEAPEQEVQPRIAPGREPRSPLRRAWPNLARGAALRIVGIGGGTGLPTVMRGLARASRRPGAPPLELTAVVSVSDDGGSSGRLRRELGGLPPGDVRNCLVALSPRRRGGLAELFQYRFARGATLGGHSVGNLLLSALAERSGSFLEAVRESASLLGSRGQVLPSTLQEVSLVARLEDGRLVRGECAIRRARTRIRALALDPPAPEPSPGLLEAIAAADLVVLGPGSLYSSLLTNLLVAGVGEALRAAPGLKVLVGNLMTEPGETAELDGAAHLRALSEHVGPVVDCVVVNSTPPPPQALERYGRRRSQLVRYERQDLLTQGVVPIEADVLSLAGTRVRHDGRKLAGVLLGLARAARREQTPFS